LGGAVVFSCAAFFERRNCGGKAGDVELRADGCAILGAGGGVGGGVGVVGDDSVIGGGLLSGKNKRGSIEFYDRASWGAAVLRPYMGEVDLEKSVTGEGEGKGEKKQSVAESYGWASWGAPFEAQGKAVLRPYTEGGADQATVIGSALRDE
jgi:hypothetical protein